MPGAQTEAVVPVCAQLHGFEVLARMRNRSRVTLVLRGEFDVSAADLFAAVVAHHLRAGRRYIAIDMSAVTFIDCTMLRAVVAAHNELLSHRGRLTLRRISRPVARILGITGLDAALRIVPSPDEDDAQRIVTMATPV